MSQAPRRVAACLVTCACLTAAQAGPEAPAASVPEAAAPQPVTPLTRIGWADRATYGAKAAGVAELGRVPGVHAPPGFAVSCQAYRAFMAASGLDQVARGLVDDPAFRADPRLRKERLKAFRRQIRTAPLPPALLAELEAMQAAFGPTQALRCRPSPDGEDLEAWLGAKLYDAKTHRPDEGSIVHTIRQVWAGLWTLRAYQARAGYGVDHTAAAMGVLVHPRFDAERADGVTSVRHAGDPRRQVHTVDAEASPPPGQPLTIDERIALDRAARAIHLHFARLHGDPPHMKLELEFKLDAYRRVVFKEARPEVEAAGTLPRR